MGPELRRQEILELANAQTSVSVDEVARRFGVSRETARRDLAQLDADGLLHRVHGGALKTAAEPTLSQRMVENAAAKQAIARAAAALFDAGDTLLVDAGSTTAFFASALAEAPRMTLMTTSVEVAARAGTGGARHRIYLIGGEYRPEGGEAVGSVALEQIDRFRADHAVLTVGAIDAARGLMDYDVEEAMVARAMLRQAARLTVLADASKFDRVALVQVCELAAVSRLVTDRAPSAVLGQAVERAGVELVIASARI
ncbi:MAG TPA: DeoR/GlpR family DNA-binding transcription regulator [Acetobacteraceae bacterium]|nr:DeoR/GlpR family DNA-binding transcription regulator [Acetobacteraceae bacterium]